MLSWSIKRHALQEKVATYFICPMLLKKHTVSNNLQVNKDRTSIQLESDNGNCLFIPK